MNTAELIYQANQAKTIGFLIDMDDFEKAVKIGR